MATGGPDERLPSTVGRWAWRRGGGLTDCCAADSQTTPVPETIWAACERPSRTASCKASITAPANPCTCAFEIDETGNRSITPASASGSLLITPASSSANLARFVRRGAQFFAGDLALRSIARLVEPCHGLGDLQIDMTERPTQRISNKMDGLG
jgi:hypothetical protein